MQNETHAHAVRRLVWKWVPVIPMVVFVKGNIYCIRSRRVFSLSTAKSAIISQQDFLNNSQVDDIYTKITKVNLSNKKTNPQNY